MKIDIEQIQAVGDADAIFLKPEGEKVLLDIIAVEKQLEEVKKAVKEKLEATAQKINPNFSMIQGDKVRVYYRSFGARYFIEPGLESQVPADLIEENVSVKLNIKAIDKYVAEKGALPYGVAESNRVKQITFGLRKEVSDE